MEVTEKDIFKHCAANLEPFCVPKLVEFMTALPKTANGKIDKKALRQHLSQRIRGAIERTESVVTLVQKSDGGLEHGALAYSSLAEGEIHVWHVDLFVENTNRNELLEFLSVEEKARAERFRFPRDREAYSFCRGALRQILGAYLGARPEAVRLFYDPHGKPQLDEPSSGMALQFNVSHSRGVGLIAVARGRAVGIDIECVRPIADAESIAQTHFSPKERGEISRLPDAERPEGFFSCWTRKEAFVKAQGGGLSIPLNSFCVSRRPGELVELLDESGNAKESLPWKVMDLRFDDNGASEIYVGALVGQGMSWHASVRKWQPRSRLFPAATSRE